MATEQLLEVMSENMRVYVRERKPKTLSDVGELAEDYQQAQSKEQWKQSFCGSSNDKLLFMWANKIQVV